MSTANNKGIQGYRTNAKGVHCKSSTKGLCCYCHLSPLSEKATTLSYCRLYFDSLFYKYDLSTSSFFTSLLKLLQ